MESNEGRFGGRDSCAIKQFLALDRALTSLGVLLVFVFKFLLVESWTLWLVLPFLLVHICCLAIAGRMLAAQQSYLRILVLIVASNWLVALAVSAIVPFMWPVMALTVMMPVVLATPYLERAQLAWIVVSAAVTAGLLSAIGLVRDGQGLMTEVADDLRIVATVVALTLQIVPIGLIVWQNNRLQSASLARATELNALLRKSEAELEASRRRVVLADDLERRRIERNLHDGAQQRLLAIGVRLRMLETHTDHLPEFSRPIEDLIGEIDAAIEDVRDLAQGIYPPLLESLGLAEALSMAAERTSVPVRAVLSGIGRLEPAVESALYFTALEALSNAAKHAPSSTVDLQLVDDGNSVRLSVIDDGPGFVVGEGTPSNVDSFRDRVAAIGGRLIIASEPGHGTTVTAVVPKALT